MSHGLMGDSCRDRGQGSAATASGVRSFCLMRRSHRALSIRSLSVQSRRDRVACEARKPAHSGEAPTRTRATSTRPELRACSHRQPWRDAPPTAASRRPRLPRRISQPRGQRSEPEPRCERRQRVGRHAHRPSLALPRQRRPRAVRGRHPRPLAERPGHAPEERRARQGAACGQAP